MIDLWRIPFKCIMDFGYNLRNILKIKVLNMKKIGLFWKKYGEGVRCELCPHFCILKQKETGKCEDVAVNNFVECDDNDFCTEGDKCSDGECKGKAVLCDDKNDCTTDSCNNETGKCEHVNIDSGIECDDNDLCTIGDHCDGQGKCVSGEQKDCDDKFQCTEDLCDKGTGQCKNIIKTSSYSLIRVFNEVFHGV